MATTKPAAKSSARTDVKIGISDSTHELNIECENSQSEVIAKVNEAIKSSSVLPIFSKSSCSFIYLANLFVMTSDTVSTTSLSSQFAFLYAYKLSLIIVTKILSY